MTNKLKAIITVGAPGSGKSTFADLGETQNFVKIERDEARWELFTEGVRDYYNYKFTKAREQAVTKFCTDKVLKAAQQGRDIVIADTNLNEGRNKNLKKTLEDLGYEVSFEYFDVPLQELYRRNDQRQGGVSKKVLYSMYLRMREIMGHPRYVPDTSLQQAIVYDIDGTLARMVDRGPFDWKRVDTDVVRPEIADMLRGHYNAGYFIVLASGRDGSCKGLTEKWMHDNDIPFHDFFIRPAGNFEKDFIIKERMLFEDIAPKYNVVAWVDDRPQVSDHLRILGVPVIQVADPHLEF